MTTIPKYPNSEYFSLISKVLKKICKRALDNPDQAKKDAHESLKRMGLLDENGEVKRNIVTRERIN